MVDQIDLLGNVRGSIAGCAVPRTSCQLEEISRDPYPMSDDGLNAQAAAGRQHDTADRLAAIAAPTLVLTGAEDILTPPCYALELADGIPDARLQILERGGHLMSWEYPEAVTEALLAFLTE